jgi:hypothetical protein
LPRKPMQEAVRVKKRAQTQYGHIPVPSSSISMSRLP